LEITTIIYNNLVRPLISLFYSIINPVHGGRPNVEDTTCTETESIISSRQGKCDVWLFIVLNLLVIHLSV